MSTLLIEILTEELPTAAVWDLSQAGSAYWRDALAAAGLHYQSLKAFQTPRRLAWQIQALQTQQAAQQIERRGPAEARAKNPDGSWSGAVLGFAQSCGCAPEDLQARDGYLYFRREAPGKSLAELLPGLFQGLVEALPIAKRMRWGEGEQSFVRPVLGLVALLDGELLPLQAFGLTAGRETAGHRIHHPGAVLLQHAEDYESALAAAKVLVDFETRQQNIKAQIKAAAGSDVPLMPEALLREVTALVEWPVALRCEFAADFLRVPQEALISTMQDNQKYFALTDAAGKLKPSFIVVANLDSEAPDWVRRGNEKVIRSRFEDAQFFWQQDLKQPLADMAAGLAQVTYQAKLGSIAERVQRLEALALHLVSLTGAAAEEVRSAAQLCKADLLSGMVGEFPELQGIMGMHYARAQGYSENVAAAIAEHYQPVAAGAELPRSACGLTLSLAEKIESLLGGFAVGAKPSGSKDPYALRRQAIALIRLLAEKRLSLNLRQTLDFAAGLFPEALAAAQWVPELLAYIGERLQHYFRERGLDGRVYQAVAAFYAGRDLDVLDFVQRGEALQAFINGGAAESFLASAKRIRNILKKNGTVEALPRADLYREQAEGDLAAAWQNSLPALQEALARRDYGAALAQLQSWSAPLDAFFRDVMVMAEDEALRRNRLALLTQLQAQILALAELSALQAE